MDKKIGPFLLSGFMIGPILGSGIILLPPLAYSKIGAQSIYAWIIMMILGALFAMIFAKLSMIYPGDGGMTIAIQKAFGNKIRLFSSFLLMSAVFFGPTAVMLTASEYVNKVGFLSDVPTASIGMVLVIVALAILLSNVKFISTFSFVLASIIAFILFISSVYVVITGNISIAPLAEIEVISFGRVVLLLFWAIIGWEIVGNYSNQVKNIKRTIPIATIFSITVISAIYLIVAMAFQTLPMSGEISMVDVLYPLFGERSVIILVFLITGLCFSTYLTIVGAVARLASSIATDGYLPSIFAKKNKNDIPYLSIGFYVLIHLTVLQLTGMDILNIEEIVSIANGFFLGNALIGLCASVKVIKGYTYKVAASILIISLVIILSFSSFEIYVGLIVVLIISMIINNRYEFHSFNF